MIHSRKRGFAIVEVLVAITILSLVLLSVMSGVSLGIISISRNRNLTVAMMVARSKLNEFQIDRMRGADVSNEPVKEYPGFNFSRETKRFEHELFGPLDAKTVDITVSWTEKNRRKIYTLNYVYPVR